MPATLATVRSLHWSDLIAVQELERALFVHDPWSAETFWSELAHVPRTRCYIVAESEGAILGYAGVMTVGDDADVQTIAVDPDAQGRGIGRLLLRSLLRTARERGCRQVFLEVRSDNAAALALYEREGFDRMGRRRDYYGSGVDAVTMRLTLRDHAASDDDAARDVTSGEGPA
jgi:ribosomal-protein-alanine N-acetyltransferase